jgi:hypothetical protein
MPAKHIAEESEGISHLKGATSDRFSNNTGFALIYFKIIDMGGSKKDESKTIA